MYRTFYIFFLYVYNLCVILQKIKLYAELGD